MAELIAGASGGAAVADPVGAGGAADGATGSDGGAAVADTPGTGDGAGDGDGAGAAAADGEGDAAADGEGQGDDELGEIEGLETDGRRIDDKTRKAIAELKKVDPESAKRVAENYFRMGGVMKEVGASTPSEAVNKVRQMVATLDSLGGEQGITDLQTEVGDYRKEISQFASGDPALLTQLHEGNGPAFTKMVGQGLELLATKDAELLDEALVPTMVARLEKAGFYSATKSLLELIQKGDGEASYKLAKEIDSWLTNAKGKAAKQLELKDKKDPEREALNRDREALNTEKQQQFEGRISTDVNKSNNTAMSKIVEPFFKELKLRNEGRREFVNALNSRIYASMKKDAAFQRAAKAIMGKGDQERATRFIHARFAELLPNEFKSLRDAMYPNYSKGGTKTSAAAGAKAAAAAPGKAAAPSTTVVPGKVYPRSAVDTERTPDVFLITGKAYLKGTTTPVPYDRESR